jgi:hypothetical protein
MRKRMKRFNQTYKHDHMLQKQQHLRQGGPRARRRRGYCLESQKGPPKEGQPRIRPILEEPRIWRSLVPKPGFAGYPRGTPGYPGAPRGTSGFPGVPRGTSGYLGVPRGTPAYRLSGRRHRTLSVETGGFCDARVLTQTLPSRRIASEPPTPAKYCSRAS